MSEFEILAIRKLANREGQERIRKFDPETGEPKLVNPRTPGDDHEPWPLLGVTFEGDPPRYTSAGTSWVEQAVSEGWLRRVGERAVVRPGGPANAPWAKPHTFIHADRLVFDDHERGPVAYKVTRQPDKYWADTPDAMPVEEYGMADDADLPKTVVRWIYELELVPPSMNQVGVGGKEGRRG